MVDVHPEVLAATLTRHRLLSHARTVTHWTPEQKALLTPLWTAATARSLGHHVTQTAVLAILADHGLPATAFKGVAFQQALTGSPFGRDHRDIDIWVPPDALLETAQVLLRHGWSSDLAERLRSWTGPLPHEIGLTNEQGVHLDVHGTLFARRYVRERAERVLSSLRTPEGGLFPVGHGLLTLLHGAKDGWSTLRHVADLALVRATVDARELEDVVKDARAVRASAFAFALLDHLFEGKPATRSVVRAVDRLRGPRVERPTLRRTLTYARTLDRPLDQARAFVRIPLQVSAGDVDSDHAGPRILHRVFRLLRTHALQQPTGEV